MKAEEYFEVEQLKNLNKDVYELEQVYTNLYCQNTR